MPTANNFSLQRVSVSFKMQWLEILRRGPTLLMIVGLPLIFFLVMYYTSSSYPMPIEVWEIEGLRQVSVDHRNFVALLLAVMGMGWGMAATALFNVVGGVDTDRRLIVCGYKAMELMIARLATLMSVVVVLSFVFMVPVLVLLEPNFPLVVWLSTLLGGFIAVGTGLVLGSLISRQLEAMIGVIAIFGIEMAMATSNAAIEQYLPLHFANELLKAGAFATEPQILRPMLLSMGYGTVLFVTALLVWSRRVGVFKKMPKVKTSQEKVTRHTPRIAWVITFMLLGAVIALGSPEAYEGPLVHSINGQHNIGLVDVFGASIAIPACLYLSLTIVRSLTNKRPNSTCT